MSLPRRVVITGYGMVTSLGPNTGETFSRAARGESGIQWIRSFDTTGLPCRIGGEVNDQWLDGDPKTAKLEKFAARGVKMMMVATREAAQRANLEQISDRAAIGVALGAHGDNPRLEDILSLHRFYDGSQFDVV